METDQLLSEAAVSLRAAQDAYKAKDWPAFRIALVKANDLIGTAYGKGVVESEGVQQTVRGGSQERKAATRELRPGLDRAKP